MPSVFKSFFQSLFRILTAMTALALAVPALAAGDSMVSVGSPPAPFPNNVQIEPALAVDPIDPSIQASGSNDAIDQAPCQGSTCTLTPGVGASGFELSLDGSASWTQPTYAGYSARTGSPGPGPIGTLPNYTSAGLMSVGDPSLAFGPIPASDGTFSYANGARLYYGNIALDIDQSFKGLAAIAVSYTDDPVRASAGANGAWSAPAIVTEGKQSATTFSDKDGIWADNAASSPHFGNLYVCYVPFRSNSTEPNPGSIAISRSTDGGVTFSTPQTLTQSSNNARDGRQGCTVRTDSHGTVYVFYEGAQNGQSAQYEIRSFDGGVHFGRPQRVAAVVDVGAPDGTGQFSFDGVAGSRTDSFPSVGIANGAPTGAGATDTVAVAWSDASRGLNNEKALVAISTNGGASFNAPQVLSELSDRPDFTAVALSPDGRDIYLTYDAFIDPFRIDMTRSRRFQGVVRHASVSVKGLGRATTLSRGGIGDARASVATSIGFVAVLANGFIGDYNTVAATNTGATAVYTDGRNSLVCPAIDAYRQSVIDGSPTSPPAPNGDCPPGFGNMDIYASSVQDPSDP
jgi:hypothetical protein